MKPFLKPLPVKLVVVLLLVIAVVIIHSCRKDNRSSPSVPPLSNSGIKIDIAQLQQIYATAMKNNGALKVNSGNNGVNLIRTLSVNWNTYTLQKRRDSSIVAEFG